MFGKDHRIGMYSHVDRLHELADALEARLDGDGEAFTIHQALDLVRTAVHVNDALAAIDQLTGAGRLISLDTHRATRAEENR